jgi:Tol biopolymer transport system component/DNA-binding winged helix-turn-helix (wHTH) protein
MSDAEPKEKKTLLHFSDFVLDTRRRGLFRGAERVRLTSKPIETLIFLSENAGRLVEKQEILDAVWKDTFVTEDTLVQAVREIRRALGENKENPCFIQTVPRQGYRFIAEVSYGEPTLSNPTSELLEPSTPKALPYPTAESTAVAPYGAKAERPEIRVSTFKVRLTVATMALIALAAFLYCWSNWDDVRSWLLGPPFPFKIHLVSGSGRSPTFSPDGAIIAFIRPVDGVPQLFVQNLAQGDPVQRTFGQFHTDRPRWSPKGDQIAFTRGCRASGAGVGHGDEAIWSISPVGGAPRKVIEAGRNPSWSSDGTRLVYERQDEIWTAQADGTEQRKVDGVPPVALLLADRMPSFSPDGSLIAFFQPESGLWGDFWIIPAAGGTPRRVTFDICEGNSSAWTPDGRHLLFSSDRSGSRTLWRVSLSGGEPESLTVGAGEDTEPEISQDGRRLIFTSTRNDYVLTLLDLATGRETEMRELRNYFTSPSFSPMGDRIVFSSNHTGDGTHIFSVDLNGANLTQVTAGNGERSLFPQWSRDGSMLYFFQTRPTTSLRSIPATGGPSHEILPGWTWETNNGARFDSKGQRILYTRTENGRPTLTTIREPNGDEIDLDLALFDARWSPDDEFIVGTDLASGNPPEGDILLWRVNVGPRTRLTRGYSPVWSRDASRVYFLRTGKSVDGAELWSINRDGSDERFLTQLRPLHAMAHFYDVSAKGQVVYLRTRPIKQQLGILDLAQR